MDQAAVIAVTNVELLANAGLGSSEQTADLGTVEDVVKINTNRTKHAWSFVRNAISNITLEPVLFLYAFGWMASQPVYDFMIMRKLCRQYCDYTAEQCQTYGMGQNDTVDTQVKNAWAGFDNYSNIINTIPVIVYTVFMGPWGDVFGRKIPMAISFVGISLGYVFALLLYFIPSLPVWMLLLPQFVTSVTGGLTSLMVSACAYAADISENDNSRTIRFALYEVSTAFGTAVSSLFSGVLMQMAVPYYVCYSISLGSMVTALLIVIIRVRDLPGMANQPNTLRSITGSLFTTKHITDSFKTLTKPRAGRTRLCIWLMILVHFLAFSADFAEFGLLQKFFTNKPLRWSLSEYMFFMSISEFGCMAVAGIFIPAVKQVFQWRDMSILVVSCTFRIVYCYGLAVMSTTWMAYTFGLFNLLIYGVTIGSRVTISKLVSDDEQGKMLSLFSLMEAISPVPSSVAATAIFTATAERWPGFFGIVDAYTMFTVLLLVVVVDYFMRTEEKRYEGETRTDTKVTKCSDGSVKLSVKLT